MTRRFVRARKPEHKDERRAQLLGTARAMLEAGLPLRDLSLNELARRAGMAKANVYRYFETREAVLLELLREELGRWIGAVHADLARARAPLALDTMITRLTRALTEEPLLSALLAALPSVLEQNLSEDAIRSFKREAMRGLSELGVLLHARCQALSAHAWTGLLDDVATVVAGLHPATHPSEAAARVLDDPELVFFRKDYERELRRYVRALAADRAR